LRVDAGVAPDYGDYDVTLDDAPLATIRGYASEKAIRKGEPNEPRAIAAGRHTIAFRCIGKSDSSNGFDGAFDALFGDPD
jgi:hypothetical protein